MCQHVQCFEVAADVSVCVQCCEGAACVLCCMWAEVRQKYFLLTEIKQAWQ